MFLSKDGLNIASLRIGKHRIVKNIASLRKVKIAHPYLCLAPLRPLRLLQFPGHHQPWLCWLVPLSFAVHLYLECVPVDEI